MALQSMTTDARNPVLGRIGQSPAMDVPGLPHLDDLMPEQSAPASPDVHALSSPAPPPDPLQQRKSEIESDLERRMNPTKTTSVLGKIGHGFATAGNILGDMFAPSTMELIPGTQLHNEKIIARDKKDLSDISDVESQQTQRKQTEASTAYTQQRPEIEKAKLQQKMATTRIRADQAAAKSGQKPVEDAEGNVSYVDDPQSAAFQSRKIHDDVEQSRQQYLDAQSQVDALKNDPNSPLYKMAITRAETARANAGAAALRAQAYYGSYLAHAKGTDLAGAPLNGAIMLGDTPVGSSFQGQVAKTIGAQSQFKDVNQGIQHTTTALQALDKEGGTLNDAAMIAALQDTTHSASEWAQGKVNATLSPVERDAVVAIKAMRERILAMRKASGGNASEGQVTRMLALLPGPHTPDLDTAMRQLKEVQSQADVLGAGVPKIHQSTPEAPKEGTTKKNSAGDTVVFKSGKWGPA